MNIEITSSSTVFELERLTWTPAQIYPLLRKRRPEGAPDSEVRGRRAVGARTGEYSIFADNVRL